VYPLFRYASLRLHHITKVREDEFTQLFGLDFKKHFLKYQPGVIDSN